jgi:hypothetical protein
MIAERSSVLTAVELKHQVDQRDGVMPKHDDLDPAFMIISMGETRQRLAE